MRNLGVHAGLALVGIIAGLPVAAVVQWNREPPAEVWSRIGITLPADDGTDEALFSPSHKFARSPGGPQVTSLRPGGGHGHAGHVQLSWLVQAPGALAEFRLRVLHVHPTVRWTEDQFDARRGDDGVVWHRIRLSKRP